MELTVEMILTVAGAISVVGGAWLTFRKIQKDAKEREDSAQAKVLAEATRLMDIRDTTFMAEIKAVNERIDNHQDSVEKDFAHIRETYNGEIRNLGQKIEDLRSELRNQHGSLVHLLTKLIENTKD